jgi:heme-degrading monooxygenase HmoA
MRTLARTPEPPYYVVIFVSLRTDQEPDEYRATAEHMLELATRQPGFLGVDSARSDGLGITVSYWSSESAIRAWKFHPEHGLAREQGRSVWYSGYSLRVARVERAYEFDAGS